MSETELHPLSPQDCLVAMMVAVSASDENIRTAELVKIQSSVNMLPVFAEYDIDRIRTVSQFVFDLFEQEAKKIGGADFLALLEDDLAREGEDGLDALFGLIRENLPTRLYETAYALACDVGAADGKLDEPELRLLEEMRYELNIDRLHAAAIERGARARHVT